MTAPPICIAVCAHLLTLCLPPVFPHRHLPFLQLPVPAQGQSTAEAFFELANVHAVTFDVGHGRAPVMVAQNRDISDCTGGVGQRDEEGESARKKEGEDRRENAQTQTQTQTQTRPRTQTNRERELIQHARGAD